jgi:heme exporter protein B
MIAFVVTSLLIILYTLRAGQLDPTPKSGLIWIIVLFAALSALGRSFMAETDKKTYDLLRMYAPGSVVYSGKLIFNILFTLFINVFTFIWYTFLLDLRVVSWPAMLVLLIFGSLGFSSVATMTAAIVSQADRRGAVFSVLSIPLFVPLVLILTRITKFAFIDGLPPGYWSDFSALIGFAGVTITSGVLLFDFMWND